MRAAWLVAAIAVLGACGSSSPAIQLLDERALQDPTTCQGCHPTQFAQWSGSMHAFASDDPVFLAMNKRGQRETNRALGTFCVQCHAPVAVQQKLTTDGLNLASLTAPGAKGVTCFYCHSAASVDGSHNNPLVLAADGESLFGPFSDPVPGSPHKVSHSNLLDDLQPDSAAACGSCHDIVNQHGAAIERTFAEWKGTLFAIPPNGQTCAACHMTEQPMTVAATTTTKKRTTHDHSLPGVDLALTPFPSMDTQTQMDAQKQGVQTLLDPTLLTTVCYNPAANNIEIDLDNAGAGHGFPSGASQDRRVWIEVTAYAANQIIYQSGVPPKGQTVESAPDADLWMIRDCMFDDAGNAVNMFWQPSTIVSNQLPGSVMLNVNDPSSYTKSHIKATYPGGGVKLTQTPDRISVKVHIKAIADEVVADLVTSGDLDPSFMGQIQTFTPSSGTAEWTMALAGAVQPNILPPIYCVVPGAGNVYRESPNVAMSHVGCTH